MTSTATHSDAARIGARIRHHLATTDWSWRHATPADPIDARAIARLRDEAERARTWLAISSAAIGMPLPTGNGTNGPWHRVAVLDRAHHLGIADIAAGRIAWTDAVAPSYVMRFATPTAHASSPHAAGGSGAMGDRAVAQVALTLHGESARIRRPQVHVVEIEHGLTTCYGDIAATPTADDWRKEWAALAAAGTICRETTAEQWEAWRPAGSMAAEHAHALLDAIPYRHGCGRIEVRHAGKHYPGIVGQAEFRVRGKAADRVRLRRVLEVAHMAYAAAAERIAVIQARAAVGLPLTAADQDDAMRYRQVPAAAVRRALDAA